MLVLLSVFVCCIVPGVFSTYLLHSFSPILLNLKRSAVIDSSRRIFRRIAIGRDHNETVTSPHLFERILDVRPSECVILLHFTCSVPVIFLH